MKKLISLLVILLVILLIGTACSDIYEPKETEYLIASGQHSSRVLGGFASDKIRTLKSNQFSFTARFDESARYDLGNNNQYDINKLMGFSDCNSLHHENSIRFGWRYSIEKDNIEIFAYAYSNSVMNFHYMGDVAINETAFYQIQITDQSFLLQINGEVSFELERTANCDKGLYYMLFPYFGGDEVSPHDVSIFIEETLR
jgi:hypothetical protein